MLIEIIQILKCSPCEARIIEQLMRSFVDVKKMPCDTYTKAVRVLRMQKPELN